ncbi:MAG: carboxypeptidase regulatory-like domain-containing protein [Planctomycetes bacterium]|nr:carboxypeptidase regulatory-like domain-containing protein [Planctomycetota bacterium]
MPESANKPTRPDARARWLVPLLAVVLACGVAALWPDGTAETPRFAPPGPEAPDQGADDQPQPAIGGTAGEAAERQPLVRTEPPAGSQQPQGLRGRIVDAAGFPIEGARVHLTESASNDPMMLLMVQQQRHLLAPVANATSNFEGSFAVGLRVVQDKVYDLFVLSERHATLRLTGLRLLPDTWHDLGELTLDEGATLRGRVTVQDRPDLPVPQAVVTMSAGGPFADAALRALPDGDGALVAHVDHDGYYELRHAPSRGVVQVAAVAPGFARVVQRDIEIQIDQPMQLDFELPPGLSLVGDVRTTTGAPIGDARIEAWPKQKGMPPLIGYSDARGAFTLHGLRAGKHRVVAAAAGYETDERDGVEAGQPLQLTLMPRNRIHVTARTPAGAVLRRYRLAVRRFFPQDLDAPLDEAALATGQIGAIHELPERRVRLDNATDHAEVRGVPDGTFVCEVEADGWAKTLSLPVRFPLPDQAGGALQRIELTVSDGAVLRGQVLDEAGRPLAGASVTTQPVGTIPDHPLLKALQGSVPHRITRRTATTDGNGRFALERLAEASYQLMIEHPDACRTFVRDIDCNRPQERTLPAITLPSGAVVRGTARLDGRVAGQMKVVLTTPQTAPADRSLRLETVTDGEGRYAFARRIPPGSYVLRAAVVGSARPDTEVFHQLKQLERSSTPFTVTAGQDVVEQHLNLPADH